MIRMPRLPVLTSAFLATAVAVTLSDAPSASAQEACHRIRAGFVAMDQDLAETASALAAALRSDTTRPDVCWLSARDSGPSPFALLGGIHRIGADSIGVSWSLVRLLTSEMLVHERAVAPERDLEPVLSRIGTTVAAGIRRDTATARKMPHVGDVYYPLAVHLVGLDSVAIFGAVNGQALGDSSIGADILALMDERLAGIGVAVVGRNRSSGGRPALVFSARCVDAGETAACHADLRLYDAIVVRRTADAGSASIWGTSDTLFVLPRPKAPDAIRETATRMLDQFVLEYGLVTPGR